MFACFTLSFQWALSCAFPPHTVAFSKAKYLLLLHSVPFIVTVSGDNSVLPTSFQNLAMYTCRLLGNLHTLMTTKFLLLFEENFCYKVIFYASP